MKTDRSQLVGHSANCTRSLNSIQEVADFICSEGVNGDVTVFTNTGEFFLNTFGIYLDRIVDMEYRQKLLEVLVPMQLALEASADDITM